VAVAEVGLVVQVALMVLAVLAVAVQVALLVATGQRTEVAAAEEEVTLVAVQAVAV
jgi:hypothetical protein